MKPPYTGDRRGGGLFLEESVSHPPLPDCDKQGDLCSARGRGVR